MWIMVAGPITAPTPEQRQVNLEVLRRACVELQRRGHVPILAHDVADPLRELDDTPQRQEHYLELCRRLAERCDAILMIGHSPGSNAEMREFQRAGKLVFEGLTRVPPAPE